MSRYRWAGLAAALSLVADQGSKLLARGMLPEAVRVPFLGSFWSWELSYNLGSAFSIVRGGAAVRLLFSIFAVLAVGAIVWVLRRTKAMRPVGAVALGMVAGGAVGNLIDRLAFGKVTDFVRWSIASWRWPVFNVADAALVVGVALLLLAPTRKDG